MLFCLAVATDSHAQPCCAQGGGQALPWSAVLSTLRLSSPPSPPPPAPPVQAPTLCRRNLPLTQPSTCRCFKADGTSRQVMARAALAEYRGLLPAPGAGPSAQAARGARLEPRHWEGKLERGGGGGVLGGLSLVLSTPALVLLLPAHRLEPPLRHL